MALGNDKVYKASLFEFMARFGFNLTAIFTVSRSVLICVN